MGFILTQTPEMGEYSAEVRRESFYLHGEDANGDSGKTPRDAIIVYPVDRYSSIPNTLTDDQAAQLEWIIDNGSASDPMVEKAIAKLLADRREWKKAFEDSRKAQTHYGTVEINLDAIPKIRAVLNEIEKHLAKRN